MKKYQFVSEKVVARIDDDGRCRLSCSIDNPEFLEWLAAGNTAEPMATAIPTKEQQQAARLQAYHGESDRLKFEIEEAALRAGKPADYTEWLALKDQIRQRFPYPEKE